MTAVGAHSWLINLRPQIRPAQNHALNAYLLRPNIDPLFYYPFFVIPYLVYILYLLKLNLHFYYRLQWNTAAVVQ